MSSFLRKRLESVESLIKEGSALRSEVEKASPPNNAANYVEHFLWLERIQGILERSNQERAFLIKILAEIAQGSSDAEDKATANYFSQFSFISKKNQDYTSKDTVTEPIVNPYTDYKNEAWKM